METRLAATRTGRELPIPGRQTRTANGPEIPKAAASHPSPGRIEAINDRIARTDPEMTARAEAGTKKTVTGNAGGKADASIATGVDEKIAAMKIVKKSGSAKRLFSTRLQRSRCRG
jgi:hypothetical protein